MMRSNEAGEHELSYDETKYYQVKLSPAVVANPEGSRRVDLHNGNRNTENISWIYQVSLEPGAVDAAHSP